MELAEVVVEREMFNATFIDRCDAFVVRFDVMPFRPPGTSKIIEKEKCFH